MKFHICARKNDRVATSNTSYTEFYFHREDYTADKDLVKMSEGAALAVTIKNRKQQSSEACDSTTNRIKLPVFDCSNEKHHAIK